MPTNAWTNATTNGLWETVANWAVEVPSGTYDQATTINGTIVGYPSNPVAPVVFGAGLTLVGSDTLIINLSNVSVAQDTGLTITGGVWKIGQPLGASIVVDPNSNDVGQPAGFPPSFELWFNGNAGALAGMKQFTWVNGNSRYETQVYSGFYATFAPTVDPDEWHMILHLASDIEEDLAWSNAVPLPDFSGDVAVYTNEIWNAGQPSGYPPAVEIWFNSAAGDLAGMQEIPWDDNIAGYNFVTGEFHVTVSVDTGTTWQVRITDGNLLDVSESITWTGTLPLPAFTGDLAAYTTELSGSSPVFNIFTGNPIIRGCCT